MSHSCTRIPEYSLIEAHPDAAIHLSAAVWHRVLAAIIYWKLKFLIQQIGHTHEELHRTPRVLKPHIHIHLYGCRGPGNIEPRSANEQLTAQRQRIEKRYAKAGIQEL